MIQKNYNYVKDLYLTKFTYNDFNGRKRNIRWLPWLHRYGGFQRSVRFSAGYRRWHIVETSQSATWLTATFNRSTLHALAKTNPRDIRMNLIFQYFQKLVIGLHFVADSMGLSSFKFVQWAPKAASILQQSAGRKRILTSNCHSRSF